MRTVTGSVYTNTPTSQAYSPSVPLSVYRDLAAELQACQARMQEFAIQNKQLAQENQLLKQEIAKTVQSVLYLQNLVETQTKTGYHQTSHFYPESRSETQHQRVQNPHPPIVTPIEEITSPASETYYIEEQEQVYYYPPSEPESSEIANWRFVITIFLIILMGFGAGYLIVRPFFDHHAR